MTELGQMLKDTRETKQLSLDDIETKTKIQKRYLTAIEEGDYDKLPGEFYTRIFVKSYAEVLELDAEKVLSDYAGDVPGLKHHLPDELPSRANNRYVASQQTPAKLITIFMRVLTVVVIIAVLLGVYYLFLQLNGDQQNQAGQEKASSSVGIEKNETIDHKQDKQQQETSDEKQQEHQKANASNSQQNSQKQKDTQQQQAQQPQLVKKGNASGMPHYVLKHADHFKVKVTVKNGKSWVEVRKNNASGEKYVYSLLTSGDIVLKDLSDNKKIFVKVGNTNSTKLYINDQLLKLPKNDVTQTLIITYKTSQS